METYIIIIIVVVLVLLLVSSITGGVLYSKKKTEIDTVTAAKVAAANKMEADKVAADAKLTAEKAEAVKIKADKDVTDKAIAEAKAIVDKAVADKAVADKAVLDAKTNTEREEARKILEQANADIAVANREMNKVLTEARIASDKAVLNAKIEAEKAIVGAKIEADKIIADAKATAYKAAAYKEAERIKIEMERQREMVRESIINNMNYTFIQGIDSEKGDIKNIPNASIDQLKRECFIDPSCKGFNTNGWLKNTLPSGYGTKWTDDPVKGLYIKEGNPIPRDMVQEELELFKSRSTPVNVLGGISIAPWNLKSFSDPDARWIWATPNANVDAPIQEYTFVQMYVNRTSTNENATLFIIADDYATIRVNGTIIGDVTGGWGVDYRKINVTLTPGVNEIIILAKNNGGAAGLLFTLLRSDNVPLIRSDGTVRYVIPPIVTTTITGGLAPIAYMTVTVTGCDGDGKTLYAPVGMIIKSGTISYGRWEQGNCAGNVPNPTIRKSYPLKYAIGKNNYTMTGDLRQECGEDPMPGVNKQYSITYTFGNPFEGTNFIGDSIKAGYRLQKGEGLKSGNYILVMQNDGNLVLYNQLTRDVIWKTDTSGNNQGLLLEISGNLVIKGEDGFSVKWQSNTVGTGCKLVLQGDGNLILVDSSGKFIWSKNHTFYEGNNGTVSGDVYCDGEWGNGSTRKNMRCTTGKNINTSVEVPCNTTNITNPLGHYGYQCVPKDKV